MCVRACVYKPKKTPFEFHGNDEFSPRRYRVVSRYNMCVGVLRYSIHSGENYAGTRNFEMNLIGGEKRDECRKRNSSLFARRKNKKHYKKGMMEYEIAWSKEMIRMPAGQCGRKANVH